jgi:Zn-dependent peptidase ImmA (M78 family)
MRPKRLFVFGKACEITYLEHIEDGIAGEFDPETYKIKININLDAETVLITIVHEICHALFYRLNYHSFLTENEIELLCDQFAVMIVENFDLSPK